MPARPFSAGGAGEVPDRDAIASPAALLPLGVPVLLAHGSRDEDAPPSQSRGSPTPRFEGDPVELVELDGADHFDVIEPEHEAWAVAMAWLDRLIS